MCESGELPSAHARGGGTEIVLDGSSKVETSPKKFPNAESVAVKEPDVVSVNDVSSLSAEM